MLSPVRYGIIGAGRMAETTALQLMDGHPAAAVTAFYEIDPRYPQTARRLARLRRRLIRSCGSFQRLLDRADVDVILNCTPHFAHAETSVAALQAGRIVVCEKPPACSGEECQAMIDASRSAAGGVSPPAAEAFGEDGPLLVHFQHLLRPGARWLAGILSGGELGAVRRVRCLSLWWRNADYYHRVAWAGRRVYQGRAALDGAMVNQTIHYVNQMLALADRSGEASVAPVANLRAELFRFNAPEDLEMEDTAVVAGTLANADRSEFVFCGTSCAEGSAGATRAGEYGGRTLRHEIVLECERGRARWWGPAEVTFDDGRVLRYDQPEGHWPFYFHVQQVLAGLEKPVTPIRQSARTMDFIFAAYAAAGDIRQVRRECLPQVEPTLGECFHRACLPSELDSPPDWA